MLHLQILNNVSYCAMKIMYLEGCSLTGQALGLLLKGHQFEFHKPQGHWRLTWSLTSGPVGLVKVHVS